MKKVTKILGRFPVLSVFVVTLLLVMIIDTFFGEGFSTNSALSWPASYNDMLDAFVFAEIIAFVMAGLYALIFRMRDLRQKIIVWVLCMVVAVGVACFFIGANDNDCYSPDPNAGLVCGDGSIVYTLHSTNYYHGFDRHDFSLESAFPQFAKLQMYFVAAVLVGNGLVYVQPWYERRLKSPR